MHFIIINGKDSYLRIFENKEQAYDFAFNYCDHSKEVIVREIKTLVDVNSGLTTK